MSLKKFLRMVLGFIVIREYFIEKQRWRLYPCVFM